MSDYNSGLPVRSEADGVDEKVIVKITDGQMGGTNQMTVDTDQNAHVEMHGNDPAGVDRVLRTSELGAMNVDGDYDASNNSVPASVGVIWHDRAGTTADIHQNFRPTGIQGTANGDVHAIDVSLFDEAGNAYSDTNPLPVTFVDNEGSEVNDYNNNGGVAVAAGSSDNHDYTVTAAKTLKLSKIWAAASGKLKIEVQVETGVGTDAWATKFVGFNSTANPNIPLDINENIAVAAGVRVRVIRTNKDNQSQDVYSTICGHEI